MIKSCMFVKDACHHVNIPNLLQRLCVHEVGAIRQGWDVLLQLRWYLPRISVIEIKHNRFTGG